MENPNNLAGTTPPVTPPTTPSGDGAPAGQPANNQAQDELTQKMQDLQTENLELQRKVTEESTIRRTLEANFERIAVKPAKPNDIDDNADNLSEIETMVNESPAEAIKLLVQQQKRMLAKLQQDRESFLQQSRQEMMSVVEQRDYVDKLKKGNPDLALYDKYLGASAREMTTQVNPKTGRQYSFTEAVNFVTEEFKKTRQSDPLAKNKPGSEPPPSGARGETGHNPPPTSTPSEKIETSEEIASRENARLLKRRMMR